MFVCTRQKRRKNMPKGVVRIKYVLEGNLQKYWSDFKNYFTNGKLHYFCYKL